MELFHSVNKKRCGQLTGVISGQNGSPPALGACKGTVGSGSEGQLSDALLAVIVEAGEDLGLAEVVLTNGAKVIGQLEKQGTGNETGAGTGTGNGNGNGNRKLNA